MMKLRIDNGLVVGNTYDKYGTKNPVSRKLMDGFLASVKTLIETAGVFDIHEVGCGEGLLSHFMSSHGMTVRGTDVSGDIITDAKARYPNIHFEQKSIYDLEASHDSAELIVCCEVLEHLDDPEKALEILESLTTNYLLVSVPREPIWRALNMLRGKYWFSFGNTPGHLNHWSSQSFIAILETRFRVLKVRKPLPWTMALCTQKETAR